MGGLVLGGGIGFNMRAHGLTCDQLVETRMVTAEGDIVICSEKENPDLFWAVRGGGGGNFGINTSFTFKPFAVTNLTRFELEWNNNPQLVFARLQEVLLSAPNSLGAKVSIEMVRLRTRPGESILRPVVTLVGQFKGEIAEFEALIAPVNAISTPIGNPTNESYWKAQESLTEEGAPKFVYEHSRFAFEPLSAAAQATIFAKLAEWPGTSGSAKFNYFLLGGAISEIAPDATAFFARDAKMITTIEFTWKDGEQNIFGNKQWLDEFLLIMEALTSKFSYVNFIDRNEAGFLNTYYGPALPKLKAIKKAVDPNNYFRFPQGIPVG
jgi:FAD/FMN-containing dehydrogenase